jgi:hypothetical protein
MTSVVEMDFGRGVVALESFAAWWQKEGVVLAPDCQQRRSFGSEILLESGVQRDVAGIVEE